MARYRHLYSRALPAPVAQQVPSAPNFRLVGGVAGGGGRGRNMVDLREIPDVPDPRFRAVRGGQGFNESFFSSILASYANIVNTGYVALFFVFLLYCFIAEINDKTGPIEQMVSLTASSAGNSTNHPAHIAFASGLHKIFVFVAKYKFRFIALGFLWIPYMVKPSRNNLILCVMSSSCLFLFVGWSIADFLVISQIHFLYASMRNPVYKLVMLLLGALIFLTVDEITSSPVGKLTNPGTPLANITRQK